MIDEIERILKAAIPVTVSANEKAEVENEAG